MLHGLPEGLPRGLASLLNVLNGGGGGLLIDGGRIYAVSTENPPRW